ncbi:Arf11p [Stylosanthes scabra]|uniref:Auxin response factor n=1 Tax=Stylosanthes scabra TaxID=79078 RepID=A0ABU6XCT3_9FABA|nr:Arf11p [Stylosanthes scabra]
MADGAGDDLYQELWRLCAGPLMDVPCVQDKVFYFPQGHIELLPEPTEQELRQMMDEKSPKYDLPSKILCRVIDVQCLAEMETDEVYARITLQPSSDNEPLDPNPICSEKPKQKFYSFIKTLSTSDTSTHGGFSVLRKHANECLPQLDMTMENPTQELVAKDIHGVEWKFKHIYRGHPKRHLLTTGWSAFVAAKKLVAGDSFVFLRGENGQLRVGVRRLNPPQSPTSSSVVSTQNMRLGVIVTASHSVMTNTMFVVYYKPRTSQFIVGLNKYVEAMNNEFKIGTRFRMRHEGEDPLDKRFCGTIVGVGDESPEWPDSHWRSLKVQWDEPATMQRPDRVSCWEIEPLITPALNTVQPTAKGKRSRHAEASSSGSRESQVLYSQRQKDINTTSFEVATMWQPPHLNGNGNSSQHPGKNKAVVRAGPSAKPGEALAPDHNEDGKKPGNGMDCWLFGVNLTSSYSNVVTPLEKELRCEASTILDCGPKESIIVGACETERVQSLNNHSLSNKQGHVPSMRTRTKVKMEGVAVGRAIDLSTLKGYDELIVELEKMFDIEGEITSQKKWAVTFTDEENDLMLLGDHLWQ